MTFNRLTGTLAVSTRILAFAATPQAQAPKGLIGTWKLNVAKSKFSPGPAQRA